MKDYDNLVKYAYKLIEIAEKDRESSGNKFGYFVVLNGIGNGKVEMSPGKGHNYQAVIDAIHLYQKDHVDKPIKEWYCWALLQSIEIIKNEIGIATVLNHINYELKKEKEGTNSFELEWKEILKYLRDIIQKKYDKIQSNVVTNNFDLDNWLNEQSNYMQQKYGKSF